ncbi:MAG: CRISPR-associated endonuclease Cas2 [Sulfurimicrobium sp.]|nr:CRISPR-associated endonuclease Cas2 [Sulfurimicrobium sp.]
MSEYLIAYDITSPKRLARMHRYLSKIGAPIQYSIFYVTLDERTLDRYMAEAVLLIDPKEDDLRCYALPERGMRRRLGKATLPEGIYWTGLPTQWMEP